MSKKAKIVMVLIGMAFVAIYTISILQNTPINHAGEKKYKLSKGEN